VQAGRALILTPYAEELRERVSSLTREAEAALSPAGRRFDFTTLNRSFVVRAGEGFIDLLGAALMDRIHRAAPGVQLRFTPKPDWAAQPLREGAIDLEIGTVRTTAPEMITRLLFRDRYVGVCRRGHPLLDGTGISLERWSAYGHVHTSRTIAVDAALARLDVQRTVLMEVPTYTSAMQIARQSDLLAVVPHSCLANPFTPDHALANGLDSFELPVHTPAFSVSAIWHPRLDQDPAHRWLRAEVMQVCAAAYASDSMPPSLCE
jgi:DNA-binding transcriptional LysR family regulator